MSDQRIPLAFCLLLSACSTADSYLSRGNDLAAKGQYDEAILNYQKAVQKEPKSGEAMYRMALANQKSGKLQQAYREFQQAVRLTPERELYHVTLADLALRAYQSDPKRPAFLYEQVATQARQLEALPKGKADALRFKGFLAAFDKHTEDAIAYFRQSLKLAPHSGASLALAAVLVEEKREDEAVAVLNQVISTDPKHLESYGSLYTYYDTRQREPEALAVLEKQIANVPQNPTGLINLALHHARKGREPELKAALQRLIAGGYPLAYGRVAEVYAALRKPEEALHWYDEGIRAQAGNKAVYLKGKAHVLATLGRPGEAREALDQVLAANPKDESAAALRAVLALDAGDRSAADELKRISAAHPNNAPYHFHYARALVAKGDAETARAELAAALRLKPDLVAAQALSVELLLQKRAFGGAHEALDRLARLQPNHPKLALWRGAAFHGQGNLPAARQQVNAALAAAPDDVAIQLENGLLLIAEKKNAAAEAAFRKLYVPGQSDTRPFRGLVANQVAQQQYENALALFQRELERQNTPSLRAAYAETAARAGHMDEALAQYRTLAAGNPKSADLHLRIGELLQAQGRLDEAIAAYEAARKLLPASDSRAEAALAFGYGLAQRHTEGIQLYRQILARKPGDPDSTNNLAFLLAEAGQDLNEAAALVQKAQQSRPADPVFADTAAWVLFKSGQPDSALELFSRLVRKSPEVAEFRVHYAQVLIQKGDRVQARVQLQNALPHASVAEERKIQALLKTLS